MNICSFFAIESVDESVRVLEKDASIGMEEGTLLYISIATLQGKSIMMGSSPLLIPGALEEVVQGVLKRIIGDMPETKKPMIHFEFELREVYWDFVNALSEAEEKETGALVNMDGDEPDLTAFLFELKCSVGQAFKKLVVLAHGEDPDELRKQGEFDKQRRLKSIDLPWLDPEGNGSLLGFIEIRKKTLEITVYAMERGEEARGLVAELLGDDAEFTLSREQLVGGGPASD